MVFTLQNLLVGGGKIPLEGGSIMWCIFGVDFLYGKGPKEMGSLTPFGGLFLLKYKKVQ